MSLQINLLKKSEQRFQGIVSMKVIVLGSVSALACITVLVFLLAGVSKMTLNANLERARREWARLEPKVSALRAAQAAAAANRTTLSELKNWPGENRPPMYRVLRAVQENVPSQMQLYHFSAGVKQTGEKDPPACTFRISGTAKGELTAVEAKRQLNTNDDLRNFCGDIKLVSSQRDSGEIWAFALEGTRLTESAKP